MTKYIYNESQFPEQIWDGTTEGYNDSARAELRPRIPDGTDWDQIVAEVIATQEYVVTIAGIVGVDKYSWLTKPTAPNQLLLSQSAGAANWVTTLPSLKVDNITLDGAAITSDTGGVSLGDDNLTTNGTISGMNVTSGVDPGHTHSAYLTAFHLDEGEKITLGTGNDASVYHDGTNLVINPREAGGGNLYISSGYIGLGTVPDVPVHVVQTTTLTDDQLYCLRFGHRTTGTPVTGFGVNFDFWLDNSANELMQAGVQQVAWVDPTDGTEDSQFGWVVLVNGSLVGLATLSAANGFRCQAGAAFSSAGSTLVTIARDSGATLSLQTSTVAGGGYIRTTTASPLSLGANNATILVLSSGHAYLRADSRKLCFGAGDDASMYYDGTNLVINPKEVGSGILDVLGEIKGTRLRLEDNTAYGLSLYLNNTYATGHQWRIDSYGDGSFRLHDATAGVQRLIITADGKCGIGGITPSELLDVNGNIHLGDYDHLYLGDSNDAVIYYTESHLVIKPNLVGSGSIQLQGPTHCYETLGIGAAPGSTMVIAATKTYTATSGTSYGLYFYPIANPSADGTAHLQAIRCVPTVASASAHDMGTIVSVYCEPTIQHASGTITSVSGVVVCPLAMSTSAGTIDAYYGMNLKNWYKHASSTEVIGTAYQLYLEEQTRGSTNWQIYSLGGNNFLGDDNSKSYFGTGKDASIYYDGTNLVVNPAEVGSGVLDVAGTLQTDGYNAADGTAGATADVPTLAPDGTTTRTLHFKNGLYTGYTDS